MPKPCARTSGRSALTLGLAWRGTDVEDTDLETVRADLLDGQYSNPVRIVPSTRHSDGVVIFRMSWRLHCAYAAKIRDVSCRTFKSGSPSGMKARRRKVLYWLLPLGFFRFPD